MATTKLIEAARRDNEETVKSYESCVDDYAETTRAEPRGVRAEMFQAFIAAMKSGAQILEIGSGPGWDADRLEAKGFEVDRTDVTQAFIDYQAKRDKQIRRLDVIADDISNRYDGLLCLYVLQHIARPLIDDVLRKLSNSLHSNGAALIGLREGEGDVREVSSGSRVYHLTLWPRDEFIARLARVGLITQRQHTFSGNDGEWLIVLARKR